jgi:hypothetical protein
VRAPRGVGARGTAPFHVEHRRRDRAQRAGGDSAVADSSDSPVRGRGAGPRPRKETSAVPARPLPRDRCRRCRCRRQCRSRCRRLAGATDPGADTRTATSHGTGKAVAYRRRGRRTSLHPNRDGPAQHCGTSPRSRATGRRLPTTRRDAAPQRRDRTPPPNDATGCLPAMTPQDAGPRRHNGSSARDCGREVPRGETERTGWTVCFGAPPEPRGRCTRCT